MQLLNQAQRSALYLFCFSVNFEIWDPLHSGGFFSAAKLAGIIYIATIAPQFQQFIRTDKISSVLAPIGLFFIFLTMVSLFNVNYVSSTFFNFSIFLNILFFWLLINHVRYDYLILERGLLSFALGSFALALLYSIGVGVEYVGERVTIFGENQNAIGSKMSISIVVLLIAVIQNRLKFPWYRYLLLIPLPFLLRLMAETGSRIAFIQLVMSLIIGGILFKTNNIRGKAYVFAIGIILLVIMGIVLLQSDIMMKRLFETAEDSALGGRSKIWNGILPLIFSNPIIGVGETGYEYFSMITFSKINSPHNVILELICYSGIIGLTIYLVHIYQICIRGYQSYSFLSCCYCISLECYSLAKYFTIKLAG